MKLKEFLNTCMNQYTNKRLFSKNWLFTIRLLFENKSENILESEYILKHNYIDDENYIMKYRNREIRWWKADGINDLIIEIEGNY